VHAVLTVRPKKERPETELFSASSMCLLMDSRLHERALVEKRVLKWNSEFFLTE
jgi:hypothetical protein